MKRSKAVKMLNEYLAVMEANGYELNGEDLLEWIEGDMGMLPPYRHVHIPQPAYSGDFDECYTWEDEDET
jgi:hypothetical protein